MPENKTTYYKIDEQGIFTSAIEVTKFDPVPSGTTTPPPETTGAQVACWHMGRWEVLPEYPVPSTAQLDPTSQFELDQARYSKRAAVKDDLIAYMAADNMSRVRSGQWTVAELTGLMNDPDVSAATAYMGTLSYELAAQAIANAQTPLLTPEIKSAWVSKLQEHFYLAP